MKLLSFKEVQQIQKMTYNNFSKWFVSVMKAQYEVGLHDGENELNNATVEQWKTFIDNTPGSDEVFCIALTVDEFCDKLLEIDGLGPKMLDKICKKFDLYESEENEDA